jgi:hypothetical protein
MSIAGPENIPQNQNKKKIATEKKSENVCGSLHVIYWKCQCLCVVFPQFYKNFIIVRNPALHHSAS